MDTPELPEGGEWATGSLLDKSNVGKYVHLQGKNYSWVGQIAKVGRKNIHVHSNRYGGTSPYSVHVEDGGIAYAEFGYWVQTDEHQAIVAERIEFSRLIRDHERTSWRRVSSENLRRIAAILKEGQNDA